MNEWFTSRKYGETCKYEQEESEDLDDGTDVLQASCTLNTGTVDVRQHR